MAVLGWGSTGPEVERLQQRLADAGFYVGLVDGRYGALTFAAVQRFQRSVGLPADGIAGPQTLAALDSGADGAPPNGSPGGGGSTQAMSLHIGINRVDPAAYGGWDGALSGCEADARTMLGIAQAEGFTARSLFAPAATAAGILAEIRRAAQTLRPGGTFLVSYAGHGGQVADPAGDEETDHMDETWVAYDRQVLDDELYQAYADFPPGVDIVVVSDSCHSGTVCRMVLPGTRDPAAAEREWDLQFRYEELKLSYYRDLAVSRPGPGEPTFASYPVPAAAQAGLRAAVVGAPAQVQLGPPRRTGPVFAPEPAAAARSMPEETYATRAIPLTYNLEANELQRDVLAARKQQARSRGDVRARAVLLAGCADNQLSQEVGGAGVFTTALSRVWAANAFAGTYQQLIDQVRGQLGPTQTPQLTPFGADPQGLVARTPFNVTVS